MKMPIAILFILVCCTFGTGLLLFDSITRGENKPSATRRSECEYEVWTDVKTGRRFLVATRKWNIGGVGVCLIPETDNWACPVEEEAVPDPVLAEKVILESVSDWKDIQ